MAPPGNSLPASGASLDTSGAVPVTDDTRLRSPSIAEARSIVWSDLSPFAQGYVEAIFASLDAWIERYADPAHGPTECPPGFSDLAPSTLAAILKDCEIVAPDGGLHGYPPSHQSAMADARGAGAEFWRRRNKFTFKRFPPLTVSLNDAGQVVIGPSVAESGGSPASPVKSDSAEGH